MNIIEEVRLTIKKNKLFSYKDKVLVAVSGGADSVCLLHMLKGLQKEFGLKLYAAHLDHMLRAESGKDALFVKGLCARLGITLSLSKIDVKKKKGRLCIEEAARNFRQDFLVRTARKIKADKVALAHNLDDQAETVLMRILRGTGLYGLCGISFKRDIRGVNFIRPLMSISRAKIENYLKREKISFCLDKTNREDVYLRNRIRHELLPLLEKRYNRNIREALFNLAQCAGADYDYLTAEAKEALCGQKTRLKLASLTRLHPSVMRLKIRGAISALQGDTRRISFKHVSELEDLIFNRPEGSIVDLPKGVSAAKKKNALLFYLR